jgi:sugar-specific transcriptional regulator TrmB
MIYIMWSSFVSLEAAEDEGSKPYGYFSSEETNQLMDSIVAGLVRLGLTNCQAKVYGVVLKLGRASARTIAKECLLDRGSTYHTVEELVRLDLLKMELGTPNLYSPRNTEKTTKRLLNKFRYDLESRVQTASEITSEVEKLKRYRIEKVGPSVATSYRLERNRAQAAHEFYKFLKDVKGEVLFVGPARSVSKLANDFEIFKDSRERGIVWRCITEVNDTNKQDVKTLSKYCQIRQNQRIPMLMTIFDRKIVVFGGTPTYLANSEYEDETHFVFEDPILADVFALMFEALWKTSKELGVESKFKSAKVELVTR